MDQCTHEVRAEYWKKIIQACGQRPAGQSAKSWMDENGICEQSYYHWQRRFRKQAYEEMKGNRTSEETNTYMVSDKLDLRKGIDGLATIIGDKYGQNPFEKGTLFLFCGKRSDRCKGLLWMGTGFLLLYKRFEAGRLSWPRNTQEAADLTEKQYKYLMMGLNPLDPKIKDVDPKNIY